MEGEVKGKTFKMNRHTLPGINQRLDAKATNVAEQGLAGSSAFQQFNIATQGVQNVQAMRQQRNPRPPGGVGGMTGLGGAGTMLPGTSTFTRKPSVAKDKAYRHPGRPENKAHNAKAATEYHYGYPHGPKPAAPKSKPSIAKIYNKEKGKRTEY